MDSSDSEFFPTPVKILIAGGFGVGKTTFVGTVSEIDPLVTEERITVASIGVDDLSGIGDKTTTTVAMDFGRRTFPETNVVLYLFGTPGQERFWFMWDDLLRGALGAVVLADTRRLADSFASIEFFERRGVPFVVAVNRFDDAFFYPFAELREALQVSPSVPVALCDARDLHSSSGVLKLLANHILAGLTAAAPPTALLNPVWS